MGSQTKGATARVPRGRRIHSIHLLLRGEEFAGQIQAGSTSYDCRFRPGEARISAGRLELSGVFSVIGADGRPRTADSVKATLASVQGGYGSPPGAPAYYTARISSGLSEGATGLSTEFTGAAGHVGVLYFHLSPLDARSLGVNGDLGKVQLNVRLAPVSQEERELQWLLSAISGALLGSVKNESLAQEYLDDINRRLKT